MKKLGLILALVAVLPTSALTSAAFAAEPEAQSKVAVGKMVYDADGKRLAAVYKLDSSGAPQLVLDGKMVTVPISTLTEVEGKIATSLTKRALLTAR